MSTHSTTRAPSGARTASLADLRWAPVAQSLAPLLFAVPVFVSIAVTLVRVLGTAHPDLQFSTTVNSDAEALFLGQTLYQDPADGYTGQVQTPLFPFLVSLFHHVVLWTGWPLVLNLAATLSLIGLTARLAYRRRADSRLGQLLTLAGALGMGAVAWWLVSVLPVSVLYEGRHDHVAWAFALFGLVLLAYGAMGSARALVAAVLLLSAAIWTKQTTVVAAGVAVVWILAAAALGAVSFRRSLAFCSGVVTLNLVVLGVLNLMTDGWQYYFDFEVPREQPKFASYWPSMREFFKMAGAALALPAVLAAGLAVRRRTRRGRAQLPGARFRGAVLIDWGRALRRSTDVRLASLLLLFALVDIPAVVYFRLKVGAEVNQYIGVLWTMGILAAIAYRRSRSHGATALFASVVLLALFLAAQRPGHTVASVWVAPLARTAEYSELPPRLLRYARSHLVYHPVYSDLNVSPQGTLYPNFYNFVDLLAVGRQPKYLVRALLDRRFDAVAPFRFTAGGVRLFWELYASGARRQEANYFWKLNEVIRAGYRPDRTVPSGFLGRRPGPHRAPWMRRCFGPFRVDDVRLGIRAGGGFWCREGGSALVLRKTPAAFSEVHALDSVEALRGTLAVTPRRGSFRIRLRTDEGRQLALRGRVLPRRRVITLEAVLDARPPAQAMVRAPAGTRLLLAFRGSSSQRPDLVARGSRVTVKLPEIGAGDLSLIGSRDSRLLVEYRLWELVR